jgi:hypothetical protein
MAADRPEIQSVDKSRRSFLSKLTWPALQGGTSRQRGYCRLVWRERGRQRRHFGDAERGTVGAQDQGTERVSSRALDKEYGDGVYIVPVATAALCLEREVRQRGGLAELLGTTRPGGRDRN